MGFLDFFKSLQHDADLLQFGLIGALFLYIGICSAYRKWYHADSAMQPVYYYRYSLLAKIILNVCIVILYLVTTIYAFSMSDYWIKMLKWFLPFPLISLFLESNLLIFQYQRRISSKFSIHGFSWCAMSIISALSFIIYLAMIENEYHPIANLILNLCQLVLFLARTIVQLSFSQDHEQLNYSDLEEGLLNANRTPTIDSVNLDNDKKLTRGLSMLGERSPKNSDGITVMIKSTKKVGGEYQYQLSVNYKNKVHKIYKKYGDFCELDEILRDHVDHAGRYVELSTFGKLTDSEVSQAIRKLQSYIDNVLSSFDPQPTAVIRFLNIQENSVSPTIVRELAISKKKVSDRPKHLSAASDGSAATPDGMRASLNEEPGPEARNSPEPKPFVYRSTMRGLTVRPDKDFCPYITVELLDAKIPSGCNHYEYRFELSISEHSEEGSWVITKRYREFKQLYEALVEKKLKPPKLPPSRMMSSPQIVQERKTGLTLFLEILLNEEVYLKCEEVAAFVSLNSEIQRLFLANSEKFDFSDWRAEISQYRVRLLDDKTPITEFIITVFKSLPEFDESSDPESKKLKMKSHYKLYKRMTDFENLYNALVRRFGKDGLPQLPPKFNAFFTQTTVESRMKGLEKFLNSLFKFPEVEDCFAFRKFLNAPISELRRHNKRSRATNSRGEQHREEEAKEEEEQPSIEESIPSSLGSQTDKLETIQQLRHKMNESREHFS